MTGNERVIQALNDAVQAELQGIQHFGFGKLAIELTLKHAKDEMRHLGMFIDRILFLEGTPNLANPLPLKIGADVLAELVNDLEGEYTAVQSYAEAAKICEKVGDIGSRDLFTAVLKDEEGHADDIETQMSIINKIGLANYLNRQISE